MWECICEECGHEWEADTRVLNGWNMPASDECPNCGNIDFVAIPPPEMLDDEEYHPIMEIMRAGMKR